MKSGPLNHGDKSTEDLTPAQVYSESLTLINNQAAQQGQIYLDIANLINRTGQDIVGKNHHIGQLARFYRSFNVLLE